MIVANARKVRLISDNEGKDDPVDAELLARLGRVDVKLLSPIQHRGAEAQAEMAVIRARDALVGARVQLVNHVRGAVKSLGSRLEKSSTRSFADKVGEQVPEALRAALEPVLEVIAEITSQILQQKHDYYQHANQHQCLHLSVCFDVLVQIKIKVGEQRFDG